MFANKAFKPAGVLILSATVVAAILLPTRSAHAQIRPEASVGLLLGFPQGEFRDHVPNLGIGLSGTVGIRFPNSPVVIGGDLGFLIYGHEQRREIISPTIPDVEVRVVTSNNILQGNLFLRLQPGTGVVRPYFDGLIGFKYLFTETEIRNVYWGDDAIAESINLGDVAFGYGIGFGITIRAVDRTQAKLETGEGPVGILIDLRLRYLMGTEADYLKKGSIERDRSGTVIYDIHTSRTDFLLPFVGISFVF